MVHAQPQTSDQQSFDTDGHDLSRDAPTASLSGRRRRDVVERSLQKLSSWRRRDVGKSRDDQVNALSMCKTGARPEGQDNGTTSPAPLSLTRTPEPVGHLRPEADRQDSHLDTTGHEDTKRYSAAGGASDTNQDTSKTWRISYASSAATDPRWSKLASRRQSSEVDVVQETRRSSRSRTRSRTTSARNSRQFRQGLNIDGSTLLAGLDEDVLEPESSVDEDDDTDRELLDEELNYKWILNLSMRFRDGSEREKLFVTYAKDSHTLLKITVTWDYADLRPDSMEEDLQTMSLQRDKNMRVYEFLRDSLDDIDFFSTVTALRLKTEDDDKLHIYVTEDHDEIIEYPSIDSVKHIEGEVVPIDRVGMVSHLSGFVYEVQLDSNDRSVVLKQIPGPDKVDEFLYEVNALNDLKTSDGVINLIGVVTDENQGPQDEKEALVVGVLLEYASKGSLGEIIYDWQGSDSISWIQKIQWADQIIRGLSDIHQAGYVQGDMTLTNVVIDSNYNARIIDLNRRGCPVGWEAPEILKLVRNNQRISMFIGIKTDVYQLGMVLYGIAEGTDQPDRLPREDRFVFRNSDPPSWYREMVQQCLVENPSLRPDTRQLLDLYGDALSSWRELLPGSNAQSAHPSADFEPASLPVAAWLVARASRIKSDCSLDIQEYDPQQSLIQGVFTESPQRLDNVTATGASANEALRLHFEPGYEKETGTDAGQDRHNLNAAYFRAQQLQHQERARNDSHHSRHSADKSLVSDTAPGAIAEIKANFRPVEHQDSGFVDEHGYARYGYAPPVHQDSGFDEAAVLGMDDERFLTRNDVHGY